MLIRFAVCDLCPKREELPDLGGFSEAMPAGWLTLNANRAPLPHELADEALRPPPDHAAALRKALGKVPPEIRPLMRPMIEQLEGAHEADVDQHRAQLLMPRFCELLVCPDCLRRLLHEEAGGLAHVLIARLRPKRWPGT